MADTDTNTDSQHNRQFVSHGKAGELLAIYLLNLVLTILTLGFFRFWAKTRVRRYLWNRMSFDGERLEYSGLGRELFFGFLFAAFVILMPFFLLMAGARLGLEIYAPDYVYLPDVVQPLVILYLLPVAIYRARRYRLSRTLWRGIRGSQTGSPWVYANWSFLFLLLNLPTLGLAWPVFRTKLNGYLLNHTWFGDRQFKFSGGAKPLYKTYLPVWGLYAVLIAAVLSVPVYFGFMDVVDEMDSKVKILGLPALGAGDDGVLVMIWGWSLIPMFMAVMVLFAFAALPWYWYRAAEYRYFTGCTLMEGIRFRADVPGWPLARLLLANQILLVLTLWIALPVVYLRNARFIAGRLRVTAKEDFAAIAQSLQPTPTIGEGLADAFDIGEF